MNQLGISAARADGSYNLNGEVQLEAILAALLMAAAAVTFFLIARLELPFKWSLLVALGAALGTQVWSTASRAMWSDTWGVLISAVVIYFLLAAGTGKREIKPVLLATLLAWSYFVRPTSSIAIVAITAYLFLHQRRYILRFLITGAAWLAAFFAYSWIHFGKLLPNYYSASRLNFHSFGPALTGHLISPSRGLLVYTPALVFLVYLLLRYRRGITQRRLVRLALFVIVGHLIVISGFDHWWGGFCYGSRLTAGLVPWLVLLAVLGLKARLSGAATAAAKTSRLAWAAQLSLGAVLLAASVFINARGAIARETWLWNVYPVNVDRQPERLWSWREPQMLAGLVQPPLPRDFPPATGEIDFVADNSARHLWYGWSGPEAEVRWTDGPEAALIFSANPASDILFQIKLAPFVVERSHPQQRVNINLNGQLVQRLTLTSNAPQVHEFVLPRQQLRSKNILTFELPDARSPKSLGINDDLRVLGIAVWWIRFADPNNPAQIASRVNEVKTP
jgi:hypothetical protein